MYISVSTLSEVNAGEILVLKVDRAFGLVGAYGIDGNLIGYVAERQPDGCLDVWRIYAAIGDNRVLATAAVVFGNTVVLVTDSAVFKRPPVTERVERAGYPILTVHEM